MSHYESGRGKQSTTGTIRSFYEGKSESKFLLFEQILHLSTFQHAYHWNRDSCYTMGSNFVFLCRRNLPLGIVSVALGKAVLTNLSSLGMSYLTPLQNCN
ncbi:hypothetical protein AVEN_194474-1 [Araneus ventricosus]|uniref:Uncharacterized protein n=1 Tax=Araneus ventricosus TaxID=182803 RepID=A0A4Y2A614_ARAVE|nr:hypothetical protein AVEN_194474-1 [Araneus ventricosus]